MGAATGVTHPSGFLFCPTEDSLKDGHHLKQLLLKALTLMLDAAESYAKVTAEPCFSPALGLGVCGAIWFCPWALPSEGDNSGQKG